MAIARAVEAEQAWSGLPPSSADSESAAYGTIASSIVREAPGTWRSAEIAPLPPPVTAKTTWPGAA